jgi:hypothetical protein
MIAQYDWETETFTHSTGEHAVRQLWREAVQTVADNAKTALPEANGRIEKAVAIVLAGDITLLDSGKARVASQSNGTVEYTICNGTCECPDYSRAPQGLCKHRLSVAIYRRATERIQATREHRGIAQESIPAQPAHGIPQQYLVTIQGKPFIKYAGLLAMAQERGLTSLTADWTYNDAELSLAHAVATFADGRRFEESGDATPAKTYRKVAAHFRRVALTRSKARVLRDALAIDMVAVEELGDSE